MTLRGRILALSGAPLAKAAVSLNQLGHQRQGPHRQATTTGADGAFEFDVEPGQYHLQANRTGYAPAHLEGPLTVAADRALDGIELKLTPQAVVTGRVLDDDGEPFENVRVRLTPPKPGGRQRHAQTNDEGEFRISGVAPGSYFLQANTETSGYPEITWPDAPIEIVAGARLTGFDTRMRKERGYRVRGRIEWPPDVRRDLRHVALRPSRTASGGFGGRPDYGLDVFDYPNVLPGWYMVFAMADARHARLEIQVTDHDLDGLVLSFPRGPAIEGIVWGNESLGELRFALNGPTTTQGVTRAGGAFTLNDVLPGTYRLHCWPVPRDGYVKTVRYGGVEMPPEAIDMTTPAALEIELAFDSATVAGAVDPPRPGTIVQLWKGDAALHHAAADQDGRFEIRGVAPGEYRATANERNAVSVKAAPGERVSLTLRLQ